MDPPRSKAPKKPNGSSSRAASRESKARRKARKKKARRASGGSPTPAKDEGATVASAGEAIVAALHVVDAGLGLALIVYGGMVRTAPATALLVIYGLLLVLGAVLGAVGYYSETYSRGGFTASAAAGLLLCISDVALFITMLVLWDSFIEHLNDDPPAYRLTDDAVTTIDALEGLFGAILIILAVLEGCRCGVLWARRGAPGVGPDGARAPAAKESPWDAFLVWLGVTKRKKTDDFVVFDDDASMESALLWSVHGDPPAANDYLKFVPDHERALAEQYANNAALPKPNTDVDY